MINHCCMGTDNRIDVEELKDKADCMDAALSDCHELIKQNYKLLKLIHKMPPHLHYLVNIPESDTISWGPNKQMRQEIKEILEDEYIKIIMEES